MANYDFNLENAILSISIFNLEVNLKGVRSVGISNYDL